MTQASTSTVTFGGRLLGAAVIVLAALAAAALLWPKISTPPGIQGAILPTAKSLPDVILSDHHGNPFTTADFKGQWHLVSYGYTHCPDVCPTLLANLAGFQKLLDKQKQYNDLQIVFYSIDPERDSAKQLASYVPWFDKRFIGLRADHSDQGKLFEHSLGMSVIVEPAENPAEYRVAHGLRVYLLDDQARLRASLSPTRERDETQHYQPKVLLKDYLALRRWFADQG